MKARRLGSVSAVLITGTALWAAPNLRAQPANSGAAAPAAPTLSTAKESARKAFQRGLEFLSQNKWAPALAEFLRSRKLYPTRSNTQNAAVALDKLGRYGEALEMFETLLQQFKNIPENDLADVAREIKKLQALVGTVEIRTGERDATVMIDGRDRGTTPLAKPIPVTAGSHAIRIFKEGSMPFESHVDVAAGENQVVTPTLATLQRSGRLKVAERSGRPAEVLVDGIRVGKTPWEGSLLPGKHAVSLRGRGNLGTPPVNASIHADDVTVFRLDLEPLGCSLRVDPQPVNATIAIDRVEVGHGAWEGRLRCGSHLVEAGAEGFLPASRQTTLTAGHPRKIALDLQRNPDSALWRTANPPRIFIGLEADGAASNSFGGDEESSCTGACSKTLPLGFFAGVHGGYQFSSGIGLGLAVGYLWAQTTLAHRTMTPYDVPAHNPQVGSGDDRLILRGPTLGLDAHLQRGKKWPWQLRFGAGVLLGSLDDRRLANVTFTFTDGSVHPARYGPESSVFSARYAYIAPEFRVARRFGNIELSAGVRPVLLIAITQPVFQTGGAGVLSPPDVGLVDFNETATGSTLFLVLAGLGARYSFM